MDQEISEAWVAAAADLGIHVVTPFAIALDSGERLWFPRATRILCVKSIPILPDVRIENSSLIRSTTEVGLGRKGKRMLVCPLPDGRGSVATLFHAAATEPDRQGGDSYRPLVRGWFKTTNCGDFRPILLMCYAESN